jgi:hypothetical protein
MPGCFFCGGKSHFDSRDIVIGLYEIVVCRGCYEGNWDGWSPSDEKQLIEHMQKIGKPMPPRNSKGWFPRGDSLPIH